MTFSTASTWKKWGLLLVIVLALLLVPVPAAAFTSTTINATDVSQYSISASPGHYVYEIIVDSLPVGTNQTHVLNFNDATYLLNIGTIHSWGINNDFWVTMTYPNGTVEMVHAGQTSIFGTYKTKIQPVYLQLQGFTMLQIDLAIGTNPTTVTFSDLEGFSQDIKTSIPFTSVSGEFSGQTSTVYAYECTIEDFKQITAGNLWPNLNVLGQFLQWSWEVILGFINMIPVIGPMLVTVLSFIQILGATIIFWISYVVVNSPRVIAGGEIIIAMFAFLLAGKRPTPEKFVKNFVNYNVRSVTGFIWIVGTIYEWLRSFVETVAHILGGIKPI